MHTMRFESYQTRARTEFGPRGLEIWPLNRVTMQQIWVLTGKTHAVISDPDTIAGLHRVYPDLYRDAFWLESRELLHIIDASL